MDMDAVCDFGAGISEGAAPEKPVVALQVVGQGAFLVGDRLVICGDSAFVIDIAARVSPLGIAVVTLCRGTMV